MNEPAVQQLLATARQHAAKAQWHVAEQGYRDLIGQQPGHLEALNFLSERAMAVGEKESALAWLAQAARLNPEHAPAQTNYAAQLLSDQRLEEARQVLFKAVSAIPRAPGPRLLLGLVHERFGDVAMALQFYFRAITLAQMQGLWTDESSTPAGLLNLVRHAMRAVVEGRRQLFTIVLDRHRDPINNDVLARVERGLAIYLGDVERDQGDMQQLPKFFYVPGLPNPPFHDVQQLEWRAALEDKTAVIREELIAVLRDGEGVVDFLKLSDASQSRDYLGLKNAQSAWDAYFLYRHGEPFTDNLLRCPETAALLKTLPLAFVPRHAPEVCFSILRSGTHILPHHGVTNTRLVAHLPLIVPADCALRVGAMHHAWQEGKLVVFDDTYEHEAWNDSQENRVVLIFDIWHPDLTLIEREAITELVVAIGEFNRAAEAL